MKNFTQRVVAYFRICMFFTFLLCLNQITQAQARMRATLFIIDNNGATLMDGNMTNYESQYSNAVDGNDIWKMSNFSENFGILRSTANLVIERRSLITTNDTTYFRMWNMHQYNYRIEVIVENMQQYDLFAFVHDNYLNQDFPVNLNDTTNVGFTVNSQPGSYAANRFKMIYSTIPQGPLPVTFTGIQAQRKNNDVLLTWNVENEISMEKYIVEVATDAVNFKELIQVASAKSISKKTYSAIDVQPGTGDHFYRIKAISLGAKIQYSTIVKVGAIKNNPGISIYPNPVVGKKVQLQCSNLKTGIYQLQITDAFGKMVHREKLVCTVVNFNKTINLDQFIAAGIYQLVIVGADGSRTSQQLMIQ